MNSRQILIPAHLSPGTAKVGNNLDYSIYNTETGYAVDRLPFRRAQANYKWYRYVAVGVDVYGVKFVRDLLTGDYLSEDMANRVFKKLDEARAVSEGVSV